MGRSDVPAAPDLTAAWAPPSGPVRSPPTAPLGVGLVLRTWLAPVPRILLPALGVLVAVAVPMIASRLALATFGQVGVSPDEFTSSRAWSMDEVVLGVGVPMLVAIVVGPAIVRLAIDEASGRGARVGPALLEGVRALPGLVLLAVAGIVAGAVPAPLVALVGLVPWPWKIPVAAVTALPALFAFMAVAMMWWMTVAEIPQGPGGVWAAFGRAVGLVRDRFLVVLSWGVVIGACLLGLNMLLGSGLLGVVSGLALLDPVVASLSSLLLLAPAALGGLAMSTAARSLDGVAHPGLLADA